MVKVGVKNKNIEALISKVFSDEDLFFEFVKINDIDELYEFCLSIQDGYTKEEFQKWALDMYLLSQAYDHSKFDIDDDELENVSGGVGKFKQIVSSGLAALSLATAAVPSVKFSAAGNGGIVSSDNYDYKSEKYKKAHQIIKEDGSKAGLVSRIWAGIKRHPYATTATVASCILATAATIFLYKNNGWIFTEKGRNKRNAEKAAKEQNKVTTIEFKKKIEEADKDIPVLTAKAINYSTEVKRTYEDYQKERDEAKSVDDKAKVDENFKKMQDADENLKNYAKLQDNIRDKQNILKSAEVLNKKNVDDGRKLTWAEKAGAFSGVMMGADWLWNKISSTSKSLADKGREVKDMSHFFRYLSNVGRGIKDFVEAKSRSIENTPMEYKEAKEILERGLKEIEGQESAKREVRKFFDAFMMDLQRCKHDKTVMGSARIIKLNGPSGVGKTMTAKALAAALSRVAPLTRNSSGIIQSQNEVDLLTQVIGKQDYWEMFDDNKRNKNPDLITYIDENVGKVKVLFLDEYDKYVPKNFSKTHPLDETFRGLHDCSDGKFKFANGRDVDISGGMVIIQSTNESKGSIAAKTYWDDRKKVVVDPIDDDITGSCTKVLHDSSYEDARVTHVQFEELDGKAYKEIIKEHIAEEQDFYHDVYNINVEITDKSFDKATEFILNQHRGARPIDKDLIASLRVSTLNLIARLQDEADSPDDPSKKVEKPAKGKPWYVVYSKTDNSWKYYTEEPKNEDDEKDKKSIIVDEESGNAVSKETEKKIKEDVQGLIDDYISSEKIDLDDLEGLGGLDDLNIE